jgi:hypothetical protein
MRVSHLIAGARGSMPLVRDDRDRFDLLERAAEQLGPRLLAYCVMDTHLHVVAEGDEATLTEAIRIAIRSYARVVNARHGLAGGLLRGPITAFHPPGAFELARMIRYVHKNPVEAKMVSDPIHFLWSSARAFAGLSRLPFPNVARALELTEKPRLIRSWELVDLVPAKVPCISPELALEAAVQTFGVLSEDVRGEGRGARLADARAVFVAVGRLESYRDTQLAPFLGRTSQRAGQLAKNVDAEGLRVALTLARARELRFLLAGSGSPSRMAVTS